MPREVKAMAGTHINILAGIKGIPFPKVTWKKNDADVPPKAEIETSGTASKLEIRYCTRADCGDYTLNVENPAGSKTATCTVLVLGNFLFYQTLHLSFLILYHLRTYKCINANK